MYQANVRQQDFS